MKVIVWDQNADNILLIPDGKRIPEGNYVYGTLHDEAHPPVVLLDVDSFDAPVSPQYFSRLLNAQYGIEVAIDDILQESDGEVRMSAVYGRKTASDGVLNQAWEAAVEWLSDLGWGDYDEIDWNNLPKKKIFNQVMKNYDGGWAGFLHAEGLPATPDMMDMLRDDMNQESYEQATAKPVRDNSDMYENGRLKWSMATQTGEPKLDKLIKEYKQENPDICDNSLDSFSYEEGRYDPSEIDGEDWWELNDHAWQNSTGKCGDVANHFAMWLKNKGYKTWVTGGEDHPLIGMDTTPDALGYSDRTEPGNPYDESHVATFVQGENGVYMIDWTASQFGYREFPMVQKLDNKNWQREWTSKKRANILDPIHETLDQRVFNGTEPKLEIFGDHLHHIREILRQHNFDPSAFDFYLTGSLCTYQYSDTSDVDISIITEHEFSDEDRAELISIMINSLDGERFPGTDYKYQHFVQPQGVEIKDLFAIGIRAGYDFQEEEWVVKPDRTKAKDMYEGHPDWIAQAILISDKLNSLLDGGQYESAIQMYKDLHAQRRDDQRRYGDESLGNIVYKFLNNNGSFERLRNVGQHIAKTSSADILDQHLQEWDQFVEENPGVPFDDLFNRFNLYDKLVHDTRITPEDQLSAVNYLNKSHSEVLYPEGVEFPPGSNLQWVEPKMFNKDSPGYPFMDSMEAIMKKEYDKFNQRQAPRPRLQWTTEDDFKTSHWKPGWRSAILIPQQSGKGHHLVVADDDQMTHPQLRNKYMLKSHKEDLRDQDYWRGLYHPESGTLAHMSTPEEEKDVFGMDDPFGVKNNAPVEDDAPYSEYEDEYDPQPRGSGDFDWGGILPPEEYIQTAPVGYKFDPSHEQAWRNANNINNVPIKSFKYITTEDPTKAFYEHKDNDLVFVDPAQGAGRFMQQAPGIMRTVRNAPNYWDPEGPSAWHRASKWIEAGDFGGYWVKGFEPAVIINTPKGHVVHHIPSMKGHTDTEAHGLDTYGTDARTTGWRGLYNPKTKQMLHLSDPNQEDFFLMQEEGKKPVAHAHQTWQNAAKNTGLPINDIKTLYVREGADPTARNGTEDDYYFADPEEMTGQFMKTVPHLMRTVRNAPGYWDPEAPPSWTRLYSAWMNPDLDHYMDIFNSTEHTHLNAQGRPCNCGFGAPKSKVKKSNWKPITSSWQILAATPEEVIQLIAENDLKEGSKWDKRYPGAREVLLDQLNNKGFNPTIAQNTQWAWRHLINVAKKAIQSEVQPYIDEKWKQDQDSDHVKADLSDYEGDPELVKNLFLELDSGVNAIKKNVDLQHGLDRKVNYGAWKASELARSLVRIYGKVFESNPVDGIFKNIKEISRYNSDYTLEDLDAGTSAPMRSSFSWLEEMRNAFRRVIGYEGQITDADIQKKIDQSISRNKLELGNAIDKINQIKPLIDRYNVPFNINEFTSWRPLRSALEEIEQDVREKEEYRGLLEQVHGKDPDELWEGRVVASYPLKDGIWTIRRVTENDAKLEGQLMSHCIGNEGQPHVHGIRSGQLQAFSVRDPKGIPWATFTMSEDGDVVHECYGRHDHKVRTAWDKAKEAGLSDEETHDYVDKYPMEQELISQFIHEKYGEDHPFLNIEPGARSGVLESTPDFNAENPEPYIEPRDHPLEDEVGAAPYIRSASDLTEYPGWLDYAMRFGLQDYLNRPGSFESYEDDDDIQYDDDGDPYIYRYNEFEINDYVSLDNLSKQIITQVEDLDFNDDRMRENIAQEVAGFVIHQKMIAHYRNSQVPTQPFFEDLKDSDDIKMKWLANVAAYVYGLDLSDIGDITGEEIEDAIDVSPILEEYNNSFSAPTTVWQEEPTSQMQPGQDQLRPENYQALINTLQPYATPGFSPGNREQTLRVHLPQQTLDLLQSYLPYANQNTQLMIQKIIKMNYDLYDYLDYQEVQAFLRFLEQHKNEAFKQDKMPGQAALFAPSRSEPGNWVDLVGEKFVPSITSKWKLSYFEGYDVKRYNDEILVIDPKTENPVGSVIWFPYDDGNIIQYLGYTDDQGGQLHPNRDAAIIAQQKQKYPNLGMELMRWTKQNVPGPYYAAFANQKLRKVLQGEPTGQSINISPEYAEELGEPSTEISIDKIKRSKWKLALNGNNAWNPESETQSLDDSNTFEDTAKRPKWQPKKWRPKQWRREPEEIDEQSEALDSPSVEKWLKSSMPYDLGLWQQHLQNPNEDDYLYHNPDMNLDRQGPDLYNHVQKIMQEGLRPRNDDEQGNYDNHLRSRPGHVYFGDESFYGPSRVNPAFRVKKQNLDPNLINPDEDFFDANGRSQGILDEEGVPTYNQELDNWEPDPDEDQEEYTLGDWAESWGPRLDHYAPESLEDNGTVAYRGKINPEHLELNPKWVAEHLDEEDAPDWLWEYAKKFYPDMYEDKMKNDAWDRDMVGVPATMEHFREGKISSRKNDGVIFSLEPENPEKLAIDGGEPADILHLTLVYLGDADDFNDEEIEELKQIGSDFATYKDEMNGTITSMAEFPSSDGAPAQVALVSAIGLDEFRALLARKVRECGFELLEEKYGFIPHITLAYQDDPVDKPDLNLSFKKLVLRVADEPFDFYFENEIGEDRLDEGIKDESEEHPSFDMSDIKTIVEDHLELDPAYYNKESAVDWSSSPFAYHNTKPENIPAILEQGLVPWNQREQQSNWEKRKALQPVTDRVYLRNQNFPNYKGKGIWSPNHAPLQIDLSKLDPANLRADEDYAAMLSDREMAEMLGDPELVKQFRQQEQAMGNRGKWYESVEALLGSANPFDQRSFDTGSFTHHGIVPPEAISINPNYRGKLGSWKVAMPPADRVEEFAKDYEAAPVGKRPKWMPKQEILEGKNWTLDPDAVEKLYHMKDFPLKRYKKIQLDTNPENAGFYNGNGVWVNPDQDYEEANHTLWHELQHGYQDEEGRLEQTNHLTDEEHANHPVELDANQFADYMQRYPLLKRKSNWDDNIWYHVTRKENLQQIRDHGLAPRASMGQDKNFNLPVGDKVVYLHPNVAGAAAYASQNSILLFHTQTDSQDWVVLRIRNLDKRRLLPDHESFLYQAQNAEGYGDIDHHFFNYQEWDAQQEGGEWNGGSFGNSLEYLMQLPAGARLALIKDWSESHPNKAVMYIGTIPAQNIDIVGPLYENEHGIDRTHQDIHDQYYDYNDYLENMGYKNDMGGLEDDGDDFKNLFKYQPMFSKWQLAKV